MKKLFVFLVISMIFSGCNLEDESHTFKATGKLLNQVTQAPIPNAKIYYKVTHISGTGAWAYETEISNGFTITDDEGNFNADLKYTDKKNLIFYFFKLDDEFSTAILDTKQNFTLAELKATPSLEFHVREWEKLRIKVRNISPFDNNDAIEVSPVFPSNTSYISSPIYNIINNGVVNQSYSGDSISLRPYWIGTNIDSEIFIYIQNDTTFIIHWNVRRNGVNTSHHSQTINTLSDQENFYQIDF